LSASAAGAAGGGAGGSLHTSVHLGFDKYAAPDAASMGTWWKDSPYYDVGVYLPGGETHGDSTVTKTWVTAVEGQGWGIIPIWDGPQAPCACKPGTGTYPNCTTFLSIFSPDPSTAYLDGEAEANNAKNAGSNAGLAKMIVYVDIEQYDSSYQYQLNTCGEAVQMYVEGWTYYLKRYGYNAGVYSNSVDAESDVWTASPRPDDIWVPRYDTKATIWGLDQGLTGGLADSTWGEGFRAKQYFNYPNNASGETYGGAGPYQIDRDIEYAQVGGASGGKAYSYCPTCFVQYDVSGAIHGTELTGINDTGLGQGTGIREVVGGYCTSDTTCPGFDDNGTTFAVISLGCTLTEGVNNLARVVGGDVPSGCQTQPGSKYLGFVYNVATSSVANSFQFSSDVNTFGVGINDDGLVVGSWQDAAQNSGGFLYNTVTSGPPVAFNDTSGVNTLPYTINGFGQVVGTYEDSQGKVHGFFYDAGAFQTLDPCKGTSTTYLWGINNNEQITGVCGDTTAFVYDYTQNTLTVVTDPSAVNVGSNCVTCAANINDAAQIVGSFWDSASIPHGFVATPTPQ
jgi:Rv2525c-like, glycoside hydrolase-like domain